MTPAEEAHDRDKVALLYDYSKHILSLALLGIGGIVSLTQSPVGQRIAAEGPHVAPPAEERLELGPEVA